jgi:cytoskeletal protein CcmA (bactofilin family)
MTSQQKREHFTLNTIIGPGTMVTGSIDSNGFTRIDGSMQGDLSAKGQVIIGAKARMKSNIVGTMVTVGGVVYGNVLASERLIILGSGLVIGDIITRRIQADEGCLIHGRVRVCKTQDAWDKAIAEYQDAQGIKNSLLFHEQGKP